MGLESTESDEFMHSWFKKCEFCGKELKPIGLDYLYANISPDAIEYERCDCNNSQEYWKKIDEKKYEDEKRKHFRKIINKIFSVLLCSAFDIFHTFLYFDTCPSFLFLFHIFLLIL